MSTSKIVLGNEYDQLLRKVTTAVLLKNNGIILNKDWAIGGSQEVEQLEARVGDNNILVEAETYIGLSISGDSILIETLANQIKDEYRTIKVGINTPS